MSDADRLTYLGEQIRAARKRRGMHLRHLAQMLDLSIPAVHAYEAGNNHIPALRLFELADALGLDLGRLARRRALRERKAS